MAKHGVDGLGYEIVKAVISGDIKEPLTYEKIKKYCQKKGINATENHLRVILPKASANTHSYLPQFQSLILKLAITVK